MNISKLHHIAIFAKDIGRLEEFYKDVLGIELIERHNREGGSHRSTWFKLGETILMIEEGEDNSAPANTCGHFIALRIEKSDRKLWKEKLRSSGVIIENESAYTLYFKDPEGNRIGLSHYPEAN